MVLNREDIADISLALENLNFLLQRGVLIRNDHIITRGDTWVPYIVQINADGSLEYFVEKL